MENFKVPAIPAAIAILVAAVAVYFFGGGSYPLSPDPDKGARAESGPIANGFDSFAAYPNGRDVFIRRSYKKGRIRIKNAGDATVSAVAVSPSSGLMATGGQGSEIRLWDIAPIKRGRRPRPAGSFKAGAQLVSAMAFSEDGKRLLVLGSDVAELWDVAEKSVLSHVAGPWPDSASFMVAARMDGIRASEARLEYVRNDDAVERGGLDNPPVLLDLVSETVLNTFGRPFAESWGPSGRYRGYGDGGNIMIWRLCRSAACRAVPENGRTFMR